MTQIPKTKYKTEWDLNKLYSSLDDPKIERDLRLAEKLNDAFAKKYKGKTDYLKNEQKLYAAIDALRTLVKKTETLGLPYGYAFLYRSIHSSDEKAQALESRVSERITKSLNKVLFFGLSIAKIPKPLQKKFLKSKKLAPFHYFLAQIFESSKYNLSEAEEKILNLMSLPSYDLWVRGVEKVLNEQTLEHNGKTITVTAGYGMLPKLPTDERRTLYKKFVKTIKGASDFSTSEINAVYQQKKINDELRGFAQPYSSTLLGHQISEKTLLQLDKVVKKYASVSHDFYAIKAKLLKLDHLENQDRMAEIGEMKKKITFDGAVDVVGRAFEGFGPRYKALLHSFLENGQIDVYPRKGKDGGAYCSSYTGRDTYILLNHTDDVHSTLTLAHEMGHAFHSELSKTQDPLYTHYTTAVAEVASTFFEQLAFEEIFKQLPKREQIVALHNKISDDISSIFRQMACFNFELELHQLIRKQGNVSAEEIAALMTKNMQQYLGPSVSLTTEDGYVFIVWSHIRMFFYVYTYAYGQLISKALLQNYLKDKSFASKIEQFLSAGGSATPEQIFKKIGIDTSDPAFFEAGLKRIAEDVKRLEILAKEEKLI